MSAAKAVISESNLEQEKPLPNEKGLHPSEVLLLRRSRKKRSDYYERTESMEFDNDSTDDLSEEDDHSEDLRLAVEEEEVERICSFDFEDLSSFPLLCTKTSITAHISADSFITVTSAIFHVSESRYFEKSFNKSRMSSSCIQVSLSTSKNASSEMIASNDISIYIQISLNE